MNNTNKGYVVIYFYMDDMLTLDINDHMIKSTKKMLTNKFDMKDLGVVDVILGHLKGWYYPNIIMLKKITVYIMVSLDIYFIDIILLNTCS
jgi:hypothetical protein